jgi:hypothetical protein
MVKFLADEAMTQEPLNEREQDRLDALLSAARTLHYINFIIAGLSLALASLDTESSLKLPIGEITLPSAQAAVGAYLLVICLAIVGESLFHMAYKWLPLDPRRPQFAWFLLGSRSVSYRFAHIQLLIPVIATAIAVVNTLGNAYKEVGYVIPGIFLAAYPQMARRYIPHIQSRTDERGGKATFSIWLLYWLRVIRTIAYGAFLLFPVLAAVPKWRAGMLRAFGVSVIVVAAIMAVRITGGFIYKWIDRLGARFGFPVTSPHYDKKQPTTTKEVTEQTPANNSFNPSPR